MKSFLSICVFFILFILLNICPSTLKASPSIEVVQVLGKQTPPLLKKEISKMSIQVYKNGQWQLIPFQIDEKAIDKSSSKRQWVLDQSLSRRSDLPQGDGKLDEDEVILFMAKDMGELATANLPAATEKVQIKRDNTYAYLIFESKIDQKSSQSYIQYNADQDIIDTLGYKNRFNLNYPIVQEELIFKNGQSSSVNVLDRFKVRVWLVIKKFFDIKVEEENITSKRVGYRLGPIRLIRRIVAYKTIGPIRVSPKVESDFLFYPDYVQIPSQLDNPLDGTKFLKDTSHGFAGFDFLKIFYGSQIYFENNPNPIILDGKMSDEEKKLNTKNVTWWMATGDKGNLIVKTQWDSELLKLGVSCDLYYQDDQASSGAPEAELGESIIGFQLNQSKMPAGHFMLYVYHIYPPAPFNFQERESMLRQATHPIPVTISF